MTQRFIKRPKKGDIVKIYRRLGRKMEFCKVVDVVVMPDRYNDYMREMIVGKRLKGSYRLSDCNFCLPENKVII